MAMKSYMWASYLCLLRNAANEATLYLEKGLSIAKKGTFKSWLSLMDYAQCHLKVKLRKTFNICLTESMESLSNVILQLIFIYIDCE
jgi:hypothetical protein